MILYLYYNYSAVLTSTVSNVTVTKSIATFRKVNTPNSAFNEGGRYATLAAVVGISKKRNKKQFNPDDEKDFDVKEEKFTEYMDLRVLEDDGDYDYDYDDYDRRGSENNDLIVPMSSSVRLIGIGRGME